MRMNTLAFHNMKSIFIIIYCNHITIINRCKGQQMQDKGDSLEEGVLEVLHTSVLILVTKHFVLLDLD